MTPWLTGIWRRFVCLFILIVAFLPVQSYCITVQQIAEALDKPEGVTFGVGNETWLADRRASFAVGKIFSIPAVGNGHLYVSSPANATPQKQHTFTLRLRGAGELTYNYQMSLDTLRGSTLIVYARGDVNNWLAAHYDRYTETHYTAHNWWLTKRFHFDYQQFTRNLTFAVVGSKTDDSSGLWG